MTECAIYTRISQDRLGEGLGVERQLTECHELAKRLGFTVVAEYSDNDVSAMSGKARPQFEKLLASKPDVILTWHQDRLLRKGSDLERVIDLNVPVYTVSAGTLDLTTPAGRAVARTVAAWSQYESEQKAERQRSKNRQRADAGLPYMSHRVFGWESDGITLRESEAQVLRDMHSRILQGDSIRSMTAWLNGAGSVQAKTGKPWTHAAVRAALKRPRNAGALIRGGVLQPVSQIQPVVTESVHEAVVAILAGRAQPGRPVERWWLSSAMDCHCGSPMGSKTIRGKGTKTPAYVCRVSIDTAKGGHAAIGAEIAHAATIDMLHQSLLLDGEASDPTEPEVIALRARLSALEQERVEVMQLWTVPGADRTWITAQLARLGKDHEGVARALEATLATRATASLAESIRSAFLPAGRTPETALADSRAAFVEAFEALSVDDKRQLVRSRLAITVLPAKGNGYGAKRLEFARR